MVDKSQRKLFVYNKGVRTTTTYGVAIGMPGFETPVGTFQIGTMRVNPTWRNTGSEWAIDMPASIGPGYTNPLGVRAMNLNTLGGSDTGYRIHGTSKRYSIGRAASHGCVRVYNPNIVRLFDLMKTGNRVIIQP